MRSKKKEELLEESYLEALKEIPVPLLTLDPRWHQLFPDFRKTKQLARLEKQLNKLIKQQGQTNNDLKEYAKTRKLLMDNMLQNMTDGHESDSQDRSRKQDRNQRLMEELKGKIKEARELEQKLPEEIRLANQELLVESMRICYETLIENTEKIRDEDRFITRTREELKEHILVKQEMEQRNTETYKYMHDLLGAQVVEIFDRNHDVWTGEESE